MLLMGQLCHLGAGSTGDDYIEDDLSAAQEGNIQNAPIEPPLNHCLFDEQGMQVFHEMLGNALIQRGLQFAGRQVG